VVEVDDREGRTVQNGAAQVSGGDRTLDQEAAAQDRRTRGPQRQDPNRRIGVARRNSTPLLLPDNCRKALAGDMTPIVPMASTANPGPPRLTSRLIARIKNLRYNRSLTSAERE
jgi:hypothetical protein